MEANLDVNGIMANNNNNNDDNKKKKNNNNNNNKNKNNNFQDFTNENRDPENSPPSMNYLH